VPSDPPIGASPGLDGSAFLAACRGEPARFVPVWFMRQAGRALPEYRALRGTGSILDTVRRPELAAEITLQPVRRYGVDAAVLYSDIVVPVAATGFGVDVAQGVGPVVSQPFSGRSDLRRLRPLDPEADIPYVLETVRILRRELSVPLIGFAGAPFTVASYLVEGGPSREQTRTKALMWGDPATWMDLLDVLSEQAVSTLRAQVEAGATAVQLFDSWSGTLAPDDYEQFVLPATSRIFDRLADLGVPRILFGVGTGQLLELMAASGADVIGVDWRVPLDQARARLGDAVALQGNLDPSVVLAGWGPTERKAKEILERGGGRGHIFNLGHGVLPETDPDVLARVVELCHATSAP
jgi:uroporphyrinogen decarboxylase